MWRTLPRDTCESFKTFMTICDVTCHVRPFRAKMERRSDVSSGMRPDVMDLRKPSTRRGKSRKAPWFFRP